MLISLSYTWKIEGGCDWLCPRNLVHSKEWEGGVAQRKTYLRTYVVMLLVYNKKVARKNKFDIESQSQ